MIAIRELRRARLRFSLFAGAVGLLVYLILFQQVLLGALLQGFTGALERQSGTVLVYGAEARKNVEGSVLPPATVAAVAAVPGVEAAAPLGEGTFTITAGAPGRAPEQVDATVIGFVPDQPGTPTAIVDGRLPARDGEAVASREDAAKGFGLGATVQLAAGGDPLTVVGLTDRSRFSVAPTLWVPYSSYERLRRTVNPDATAVFPTLVAVRPTAGTDPATVAKAITAAVPRTEALTREQAASEAPGVAAVKLSFSMILGLAFLVVTLVIGFFFVILTTQKAPSLTLLRAVGAPSGFLVRNLLVQVALVVGTGIALGVGLLVASTRGGGALPLTVEPRTVAVTAAALAVLAFASAAVAMIRILRIDPHDVVGRPSLGGLA